MTVQKMAHVTDDTRPTYTPLHFDGALLHFSGLSQSTNSHAEHRLAARMD
jgi:hypothetical protein